MIQYEYKVVSMADSTTIYIENMLNEKGADGWELISIAGGPTVYYYFFKRQIVTLNS